MAKEALIYSYFVIASEAKQSRMSAKTMLSGLPRRCAPRNDGIIQRFPMPHEQLDAWKFSMERAKSVYQMTAAFPAEARYGLTQRDSPPLKKGGRGDLSRPEYGNPPRSPFSKGGSEALETQMQLAVMLGFTTADHAAFDFADHTGKLLTGLHKKWNTA